MRDQAPASLAAVKRCDAAVLERVLRARRPSWRAPAHAVTALGETPVMVGLLFGLGLQRPRRALADVGVLSAALVAREAVAWRVRRARPDPAVWWAEPTGFSMPSRHTFTAVLGLGLLADRLPRRRVAARRVARGLAAGVGASRVVLGVHWPSDVAAGYALGAAVQTAVSRSRGQSLTPG